MDRFKFRFWNNDKQQWHGRDVPLYKVHDDNKLVGYTVEQCTGLKDKNGNLVYEGDVLSDGDVHCVVMFGEYEHYYHDGMYGWYLRDAKHDTVYDGNQSYMEEGEVIGNIHTTHTAYAIPELLS